MIYLVFTEEGFEQAKPLLLEDNAILWINADILSEQQQAELNSAKIAINILPTNANASNEKSVLAALDYVERHAEKCEIFVEYL